MPAVNQRIAELEERLANSERERDSLAKRRGDCLGELARVKDLYFEARRIRE